MRIILTLTLLLNLIFFESLNAQTPGCTNNQACNFNPAATQDDGSCVLPLIYIPENIEGIAPAIVTCFAPPANYVLADQICAATIIANDPYCVNTDWDNICQSAYNICAYGCAEAVDCLDPAACNYDPAGSCDKNLCTYPGCNDVQAYNYNPTAGCDDGSCAYFNDCGNPVNNGTGLDFIGYTEQANWLFDFDGGNGTINMNSTSLTIEGENTGIFDVLTRVKISLPVGGNVSFQWQWTTLDGV